MQQLLLVLDEAFSKKSWHGTNLRGSIRSVSAKDAVRRPGKGRKCIWEHVLHAAYWKYVVRRKLTGEKKGSFPLKGSNWIAPPADPSEADWRAAIKLLEKEHAQLKQAVAALSPKQLDVRAPGSTLTYGFLARGVVLHDIYHTGQIQFIKKAISQRA